MVIAPRQCILSVNSRSWWVPNPLHTQSCLASLKYVREVWRGRSSTVRQYRSQNSLYISRSSNNERKKSSNVSAQSEHVSLSTKNLSAPSAGIWTESLLKFSYLTAFGNLANIFDGSGEKNELLVGFLQQTLLLFQLLFQSWYDVKLSSHRLNFSAKLRCAVFLCTQNFWAEKQEGRKSLLHYCYNLQIWKAGQIFKKTHRLPIIFLLIEK